jgi:hypothetical protein
LHIGGPEHYGYPLSDEWVTPSGRGYGQHFRAVHLPGTPEASIYWTPSTGAHEVYGAIRAKWAEWNWEKGYLGFPVSGEFAEGANRRSNFEYGFIRWNEQSGAQVHLYRTHGELLTERCSGEVVFPASYNDGPNSPGAVILKRSQRGLTDWSPIIRPGLDDSGRVRWYCRSRAGNFIDPGTWKIGSDGVACKLGLNIGSKDGSNKPETGAQFSANCEAKVNLTSFDNNGWTAERSRCDTKTDYFRARLDRDRLLEIVCIQP